MPQANPLKQIVVKQKEGKPAGTCSCCSANDYATEAALEYIKRDDFCVPIEATTNQVGQNGGCTGMTPKGSREFVLEKAKTIGVSEGRMFLGRDYLGPLTFVTLPEEEAVERTEELIRCYMTTRFTKIHIDTSMKATDDDLNIHLSDVVIAERGVYLARIYEETYQKLLRQNPNAVCPIYIAESEVPIPEGVQGEGAGMQVTRIKDFKATIKTFEEAFAAEGLKETWKDAIGVVIQPSVEKKDGGCTEYDRSKTRDLMASIKEYPSLTFEGHSTDYQTKFKLRGLIEDGVGILKIGPGLTYAIREAPFTLANIETAVYHGKEEALSDFIDVLEEVIMEEPKNWKKRYHGDDDALWFKRKYNFSDRSRYYMPNPNVTAAEDKLIANLRKSGIPLSILPQLIPVQYIEVREGCLGSDPEALIRDRIINTIDEYLYTTYQEILS